MNVVVELESKAFNSRREDISKRNGREGSEASDAAIWHGKGNDVLLYLCDNTLGIHNDGRFCLRL